MTGPNIIEKIIRENGIRGLTTMIMYTAVLALSVIVLIQITRGQAFVPGPERLAYFMSGVIVSEQHYLIVTMNLELIQANVSAFAYWTMKMAGIILMPFLLMNIVIVLFRTRVHPLLKAAYPGLFIIGVPLLHACYRKAKYVTYVNWNWIYSFLYGTSILACTVAVSYLFYCRFCHERAVR